MKVRANSVYRFNPCMWDVIDPKVNAPLCTGDIVRVKNMRGCPPANTMQHAHIVNAVTGEFIGLVHTNSLEPASEATKRHIRKITK